MATPTYTKTGNKATTAVKLPKTIFAVENVSQDLLKQAYNAYLANGRQNNAKVKTRGEVSGGGKKPWKQKGTGHARFGSSRVPIWRGGGITFGPTGQENYTHKLPTELKRSALRQALTIKSSNISVVEAFEVKTNKTSDAAKLLNKLGVVRRTLVAVEDKTTAIERATRNIPNLKIVQAKYLNVYDILNADTIILTSKSIDIISEWLEVSSTKVSKNSEQIAEDKK